MVVIRYTRIISQTSSLTSFTSCTGSAGTSQSFSISGTNINTGGIVVTPPAGFEVSTQSDFSSSVGTNSSPLIIGSAGTVS
jgi:hypothetical protein